VPDAEYVDLRLGPWGEIPGRFRKSIRLFCGSIMITKGFIVAARRWTRILGAIIITLSILKSRKRRLNFILSAFWSISLPRSGFQITGNSWELVIAIVDQQTSQSGKSGL
ncbi:MAG: hypothetical protein ACTSRA_15680, partial [Promethearchaeota archaeon]